MTFKDNCNVLSCIVGHRRHAGALYVNIPVDKTTVAHLVKPPCVLDEFNGKCWVSIVVDDLERLEVYCGAGLFVPTPMSGWMMKLNLLVRCPVPTWNNDGGDETVTVSGYQIVEVHFEGGIGGQVKALGARKTQKVPSSTLQFGMSRVFSGEAINSNLEDGMDYAAKVYEESGKLLLSLTGVLKVGDSTTDNMKPFFDFVINRPNKFLFQKDNNVLAYSPETGVGAEFSSDGCAFVEMSEFSAPVLERISTGLELIGVSSSLPLDDVICFVQPYYILVDHHNTVIS